MPGCVVGLHFSRPHRPVKPLVVDTVAAVVFAALMTLFVVDHPPSAGLGWSTSVIVGATAPLAVRRIWPVPVLATVLAASLVAATFDIAWQLLVAPGFATYAVALTRSRPGRRVALATAAACGAALAGGALFGTAVELAAVISDLRWFMICSVAAGIGWTLGEAVRERQLAHAEAAAQLAQRAVVEERLRIAQELHDIVSHTLSLIGVKAAVTRHLAHSCPEDILETLQLIEDSSRDALNQMRTMLGVLRAGDRDGSAEGLSQPGMEGIAELARRAQLAGVGVDLELRANSSMSQALERSIYRIVQEAVTNVIKHAAPTRCRVRVNAEGGRALVEVADDGTNEADRDRRSAGPSGHGLIGMRERVLAHGGNLSAGRLPHGGFLVRAELPVQPTEEPA